MEIEIRDPKMVLEVEITQALKTGRKIWMKGTRLRAPFPGDIASEIKTDIDRIVAGAGVIRVLETAGNEETAESKKNKIEPFEQEITPAPVETIKKPAEAEAVADISTRPSTRDLLFKKFEPTGYRPPPVKVVKEQKGTESGADEKPSFVDGYPDPNLIRSLLKKKFNLTTGDGGAPETKFSNPEDEIAFLHEYAEEAFGKKLDRRLGLKRLRQEIKRLEEQAFNSKAAEGDGK